MNIADFKHLDVGKFNTMSLSELQYYIEEGNKLLAKMTAYDPLVWEIMDALHAAVQAQRA